MPQSQYHALITDLDGTAVGLSSDGSDVTPYTQTIIKAAQANGKLIGCATGRRWLLAKPVVMALGLTTPSIVEGGALIVDSVTGKPLWYKELETPAVISALQIFKKHAPQGIVTTSIDTSRQKLGDVNRISSRTRFLYLLGVEVDTARRICDDINAHTLAAAAHSTPSWVGKNLYDIHVTHKEATKGHAIQIWKSMLGVPAAQIIGLGDSMNDVPLFNSVALKVAVEASVPSLKELADCIAPAPDDDGLAYAIEHFLLAT